MSNLLALAFKKSYPADVKEAARSFLQHKSNIHPDAFKADINRWQILRKDGVGGSVHVDRIDSILRYHAQLTAILTKLPPDINLEIAYAPIFAPEAVPVKLKDLVFELASVIFNLAALYSQLADNEDRSHMDGIKRAVSYNQQAAGTLSHLRTVVLPKFTPPSDDEENVPLDLTSACVHGLEYLMLAQAQECFWQRAKIDNHKNSLLARLAANACRALQLLDPQRLTIRDTTPSIKHIFPSAWLAHLEVKWFHFEAVAQYRKSVDDLEASRYGLELGRLIQTETCAKKAYDIARRGKVSPAVIRDAQSLLDAVKKDIVRAQRDNDLIYHQDVPAPSALPQILHAAAAQLVVPEALKDPSSVLGGEGPILGELLSWGTQEAINIYNDRKQNLLKDDIIGFAEEMKREAESALQALGLPSSLDALERRVGLPPSLLQKSEEVRLENGPAKVEKCLQDVQTLADYSHTILNEAMDILDNEASEDENARQDISLDRPTSHEANVDFVAKAARYRGILDKAADSDAIVRHKWDEWEDSITELTWDPAELEASIPSSSITASASSAGLETQRHARKLRSLLESLSNLERDRQHCITRARTVVHADDIQSQIVREARRFESLGDIEPSMFEDVMEAELSKKYDPFLVDIQDTKVQQDKLLAAIEDQNEVFLRSRKDDPSIKERERALQGLDITYHKYRDIVRNLEEGVQFYNDLLVILTDFKEDCKRWSILRQQEISSITQELAAMSLQKAQEKKAGKRREAAASPGNISPKKKSTPSFAPPSLDSAEFEELVLPGPPPPSGRHRQ